MPLKCTYLQKKFDGDRGKSVLRSSKYPYSCNHPGSRRTTEFGRPLKMACFQLLPSSWPFLDVPLLLAHGLASWRWRFPQGWLLSAGWPCKVVFSQSIICIIQKGSWWMLVQCVRWMRKLRIINCSDAKWHRLYGFQSSNAFTVVGLFLDLLVISSKHGTWELTPLEVR